MSNVKEIINNEIQILGEMDNSDGSLEIANRVYDSEGICPCLNAHANDTVPKFVEIKSINSSVDGATQTIKIIQSLRMVRTEEGKALRKQYESGEIKHGFNEFRKAEPRQDGISNTITTVQKDNMLMESIKIRQATEQGFALCEVGGGGRFGLSDIQDKKRKSNRERKDLPDSDNGEYP